MSRRGRARAGGAICSALLLSAPALARAQGGTPARAPDVVAEVVPVLGTSGPLPWGWNQMLVRIQNNGSRPAQGVVEIASRQYTDRGLFHATAPYSVGAGASVHVRVPVRVAAYADLEVRVQDDAEGQVAAQSFSSTGQSAVMLFDVSETSRLRGVIHETPIAPLHVPTGRGSGVGSSGSTLVVGQPRFDPATGDPLLPDRAALYSAADAVLMRTDTLTRLTGAELDALAGYVLAGGTLALVPARPEDMRHPTLAALAGGEVQRTAPAPELHRPIPPPTTSGHGGSGKTIPFAAAVGDDVSPTLSGWTGGNLQPSVYGSSASYGIGEVHLLGFDPMRKPGVDDPWVQARMVDLARRGFDRRSTVAFRPGDEQSSHELNRVRQVLDPNESSRWAIGFSALLLCVYAALAGPVNFTLASKKGKPLRALRHLPIYAAVTFAIVVGIGMAAKGVGGRSRHLTLVEAGAGMTRGTARRFRGFYASSSKDLTVRTTDSSSIVSTAVLAELSEQREHLLVDRDGARLVDVAALPWQTVVVREDGFASLGDGITILPEPAGGVAVVNRSGHDLRAGVLWLPGGGSRYFARINDGERVVSGAGVDLGAKPDGRRWLSLVGSGRRVGGLDIHDLGASALAQVTEPDAPGIGDAWSALDEAASDAIDWFPSGVPVLLAQVDGGEGRTSDSGLRLESDRLLVRVVGFGGRP